MKSFVICLVCLFLLYCNKQPDYEIPLEEDILLELLIDMHLAEGSLARIKKIEQDSVRQIYFESILMKYDLSDKEHEQLIQHLKKDPEYLSNLYEQIYDSLEARSERLK